MSALDKVPENINFQSQLNFKFTIKKCPHVQYFAQQVNIPEIFVTHAIQHNPFTVIPHAGDHMEWGDLEIVFKVDEDFRNYRQIYNWLHALAYPQDFQNYRDLWEIDQANPMSGDGLKSDISLMTLTNIKNPNKEFVFRDAFPYSLSGLLFTTIDDEDIYFEATANFRYTLFEIVDI